jgi:hypothetical protein
VTRFPFVVVCIELGSFGGGPLDHYKTRNGFRGDEMISIKLCFPSNYQVAGGYARVDGKCMLSS